MPTFSVILPTYNRADTLPRAIRSVQRQRCGDWELLVVDDGSTDHTRSVIDRTDLRVRVIHQPNQGVAGARNTGLREARGEYIAFLDSDDEWLPHHLELAQAFFLAHPQEQALTSELWEDFGKGRIVKHHWVEVAEWYPRTARRLGSRELAHPPPQGDPYLYVYSRREPLGAWGEKIAQGAGYPLAQLYSGSIFERWKWGWLTALQPTVVSRRAAEQVGPFDESYRIASDYGWLIRLCALYPLNYLSLPAGIKHEYASGQSALAEAHVVTGPSGLRFHQDVLRWHEELFCKGSPLAPGAAGMRGFLQYLAAKAALERGLRADAERHLADAERNFPGPEVTHLRWLLRASLTDSTSRHLFRLYSRLGSLPDRARARLSRTLQG